MDLFAKDHPLEAAALRTQSAMPRLRSFEFEKLPPTIRHKIYRELLLKPRAYDSDSAPSDLSEDEELTYRSEVLLVEIGEGDNRMHPEIMRTNKNIHDEAAAVLYGENWFSWTLYGDQYRPMWQFLQGETAECPRRYSRLITKMRLSVNTSGDENDPTQSDAIFWTTMNLKSTCKVLSLNDLKILKVDFYNALGHRHGGFYYGERCLEPLKRCRAEKFLINTYASPRYAAELKAVIEGPKGRKFRAYRKATEDESERQYYEPEESFEEPPYEESEDENPMN